jgi:hypothetical protein
VSRLPKHGTDIEGDEVRNVAKKINEAPNTTKMHMNSIKYKGAKSILALPSE